MENPASAPVLIVNDHNSDLVALREALAPLGEQILVASSAGDGLRLATENELAVAIVDIRMPVIDGFGMVEALRRSAIHAELPVMFVSAFDATRETRRRIYQLGAVDFVPLPVEPEVLQTKVSIFVRLKREQLRAREYARELRRAAASELKQEQERFRLLVDAVSDYALFFIDPVGLVTDWTVSAERLLGYSAEDALGRHFAFLFTEEDRKRDAPATEMENAIASGQSRDERLHLKKDGTRLPVTGRLIALREDDGPVRGFAKIMHDATQLNALRESEAKFREIFDTATEGIWILNDSMVIEVANRRIAEMLGYEVPELIGRRKSDFVFADDEAYIERLFEERRTGKIQPAAEVRFRHKNGSPVWTLLSARPIFRQARFVGALDMFTDVTRRRFAEDQLRVFFESSAAGHALVDPATHRFLRINQRFCELTGRSQAELLSLTFPDVTHPEDRIADAGRFADLFAGRVDEVTVDKRYLRPDGTVVWVHLTTSLVRDPRGVPELQVSVVQDITDRMTVELQLARNRTRLRLAIETAELGVFYYDSVSGGATLSGQFKRLLGLAADAPESTDTFYNRVHPDDRPAVDAQLAKVLTADGSWLEWRIDFRVVWPDGTVRWLKSTAVREPRPESNGDDGFQIIGTARDITAEKEFEAELKRQIAERTRELDEKTRQLESFTYTVAHDLRAPLRAINGYADYAGEAIAPLNMPQVDDYLARIRSSTKRLDGLINDLLAYSRITQMPVGPEAVDLRRVVTTVLNELEPEIKERGATVEVGPFLPAAIGEPVILEQIVLNLVDNALKFTPPGQPPYVEIFARNENGRVRLHVRDHGIGIPPEYHRRIFKVFERLESARGVPGNGIGLAIVERGAGRIGGQFGVESEPGHGSTFWIDLKRATP